MVEQTEEQVRVGLMIAIPVFLAVNAGLAYIGGRWMNKLSHKSSEDVLTAHYLGGRSFGPWLTLGTMFASIFSGFTIVGVPNEAFYDGWIAFRWVQLMPLFTFLYAGIAPRLRKASLVRNHQTPADFITDMFQCQLLRYTVITSQLISQFVWMTSNVVAIKNAFNGAFVIDPDSPWLTVGIVCFILLSEWFGGLSAVALTDTVQGGIMIFGTIAVACVIKAQYGGWSALSPDTFLRPEFYQTPSREQQWVWWQLGFLQAGVTFYPVTIQRIYAASSLQSIRMGAWAVFLGPWLTTVAAVFIGTMGVSIIGQSCEAITDVAENEDCNNPVSPFSSVLNFLMLGGGFGEVAAVILYTSALAAIMSTTDSVLISISQIITSDILYPMRPYATPSQVAWFGRFVSAAVAALALVVGLCWKGSITLLFQIGMPIAMQIVPAFIIGLFYPKPVHPWSIAIPAMMTIVAAIFIQIFYSSTALLPATLATLLNFALVIIFESGRLIKKGELRSSLPWNTEASSSESVTDGEEDEDEALLDSVLNANGERNDAFPDRGDWDKPRTQRFGFQALSPKLLNTMMKGVVEPVKNYQYCLLMALAITITTPLTPEFQPPLGEDGSFDSSVNTVNGLPWWVFKALMLLVVSSLVTVPMVLSIQDDFPFDEKSLLRSGVNPEIVELEPEEKGGRKHYDDVNEKVLERREMIRAQTIRIRKAKFAAKLRAKALVEKEGDTVSARDHLRTLVKDPTMRNVKKQVEEDPIEEEAKGEEVWEENPADDNAKVEMEA